MMQETIATASAHGTAGLTYHLDIFVSGRIDLDLWTDEDYTATIFSPFGTHCEYAPIILVHVPCNLTIWI